MEGTPLPNKEREHLDAVLLAMEEMRHCFSKQNLYLRAQVFRSPFFAGESPNNCDIRFLDGSGGMRLQFGDGAWPKDNGTPCATQEEEESNLLPCDVLNLYQDKGRLGPDNPTEESMREALGKHPLLFVTALYCDDYKEKDQEEKDRMLLEEFEEWKKNGTDTLFVFHSLDSAPYVVLIGTDSYAGTIQKVANILAAYPERIANSYVGYWKDNGAMQWTEKLSRVDVCFAVRNMGALSTLRDKVLIEIKKKMKNGAPPPEYLSVGASDLGFSLKDCPGSLLCDILDLVGRENTGNAFYDISAKIWVEIQQLPQAKESYDMHVRKEKAQELSLLVRDLLFALKAHKKNMGADSNAAKVDPRISLWNTLKVLHSIFGSFEAINLPTPLIGMLKNSLDMFLDLFVKEQRDSNGDYVSATEYLLEVYLLVRSTLYAASSYKVDVGSGDCFRDIPERLVELYYEFTDNLSYCMRYNDPGGACENKYQYLLVPDSSPNVKTRMLFPSQPPGKRVLVLGFPAHMLWSPQGFIPCLLHEVGHLSGDRIRCRKKRAQVMMASVAYHIFYSLGKKEAEKTKEPKDNEEREKEKIVEFIFDRLFYLWDRIVKEQAERETVRKTWNADPHICQADIPYYSERFHMDLTSAAMQLFVPEFVQALRKRLDPLYGDIKDLHRVLIEAVLPDIPAFIRVLGDLLSECNSDLCAISWTDMGAMEYMEWLAASGMFPENESITFQLLIYQERLNMIARLNSGDESRKDSSETTFEKAYREKYEEIKSCDPTKPGEALLKSHMEWRASKDGLAGVKENEGEGTTPSGGYVRNYNKLPKQIQSYLLEYLKNVQKELDLLKTEEKERCDKFLETYRALVKETRRDAPIARKNHPHHPCDPPA